MCMDLRRCRDLLPRVWAVTAAQESLACRLHSWCLFAHIGMKRDRWRGGEQELVVQGHEGSLRFPNVCRIDTVGDGRCRLLSGGRSVGGRLQPEGARPGRPMRIYIIIITHYHQLREPTNQQAHRAPATGVCPVANPLPPPPRRPASHPPRNIARPGPPTRRPFHVAASAAATPTLHPRRLAHAVATLARRHSLATSPPTLLISTRTPHPAPQHRRPSLSPRHRSWRRDPG